MRCLSARIAIAAALLAVVLFTAGCLPILWTSNLATFTGGWLLRGIVDAGANEYTCYRNGVPIDCSELPADMQPGGS
jgi:hypothetical protein